MAALIADDDVEPLGEQIDYLAFSFIAPLGADDCDNHVSKIGDQQQSNFEFEIPDSRFQIPDFRSKISAADTKQARLRISRNRASLVLRNSYAAVVALTCLSIIFEIAASEVAPTTRSSSWPFLKRIRVGMPLIPKRCETDGLSSTFNFTTRALPAYFSATASTVGASIRHGAHQAAQKSTNTG